MVPRTLPGPEVSVRYPRDGSRSLPLGRLLLADFEGSVPWRVFRSRHGQAHLSGSYWAATTGGHVVYESRLELARLLLADGYRRPSVIDAGGVARAWESVRDGEQLAAAEYRLEGGNPPHTARPALLALLWSGRLVTDLSRVLSGSSVLTRRG